MATTSTIAVNAEWTDKTVGEEIVIDDKTYIYGVNAFEQMADFIPSMEGGTIIAYGNGKVAATETTAGEGIEINNSGTYSISGEEWSDLGYLQLNSEKAVLDERIVVNIDDSNLVATKIQARRDADYNITNSHVDFKNDTPSRGYTCIYANSTLNLTNSVYGYNQQDYTGNSLNIVAGRDGIDENKIAPSNNYGKSAMQICGKLIADNSTLLTVTGDDTIGFSVMDKGYVELKDSVLYAGAIAVGLAQSDAKKKSQDTGVDVATMLLDNSVLIRQNADNYKLDIGYSSGVNGKLIVKNDSLIDRADAPMKIAAGSELEVSGSTVKVSALNNAGTITIDATSQIIATSFSGANGTITVDMTGASGDLVKLFDVTGTGDSTFGSYSLAAGKANGYALLAMDNDLYAIKADLSNLVVNAAWTDKAVGEAIAIGDKTYYFGVNAFDQMAKFIPSLEGGKIIAYGNGKVAATETTAGEGIEINNSGTYSISGEEWSDLGYLQLNSEKAVLDERIVVNIDDSNLVVTKIQARRDADYNITNSHVDFKNCTPSRGYTIVLANSTLNLTNSVYGYNQQDYTGNSLNIVAGRDGIVEGQILPTDNYGKSAMEVSGKLIANNSTLFTVTSDASVGFGVQDKGYVELTDSVLYAGAIAVGLAQSDAKKKSQDTGVDVATMLLDNSVLIRQNADNYKLDIGYSSGVNGKLIVRNDSLIDRADAPMNIASGSELEVSGSTVKVSALNNAGAITIDATSQIIATSFSGANGTITVDMTGASGDLVKLFDVTGTGASTFGSYSLAAGKANGYALLVMDNDLCAIKADLSNLVVNAEWSGTVAGTTITVDTVDYIYGVNAFDNMAGAAKAALTAGESNIKVMGNAPIVAGSAFGDQDVTITGNATFKWTPWMYIGRDASQAFTTPDATVTFNGATISRDPANGDQSIHVSGAKKNSATTGNGTLNIVNGSDITTEHIVDRNVINVTDSKLTVTNYINVHGRDASESVSGEDETACLNVENSTIKITGQPLEIGQEGKGIVNLTDSTLETNSIYAMAKGTLNVTDSTVSVSGAFTNKGNFTFNYGSTISVGSFNGADGTITVDMTGVDEDEFQIKLVDVTGTGTSTFGNYRFAEGKDNGFALVVIDNDLYAMDVPTDILYVNAAWSGMSVAEAIIVKNSVYYYGVNAFSNMADAANAAKEGAATEIKLLGTDTIVAGSAFVGGKDVTITGKGTFSWAPWMFIGRGGAAGTTQDATVTFDGVTIARAASAGDQSIHVSGQEGDGSSKGNGILNITNGSDITADWIIDKNLINIDKGSKLSVTNKLVVAGRPASETATGEDATAILNVDASTVSNGSSTFGVTLGNEGNGIVNLTNGAVFNAASIDNQAKGTINVTGSTLSAASLTNDGCITIDMTSELTVSGETSMNGSILVDATGYTGGLARVADFNGFASWGNNASISIVDGTLGEGITADLYFFGEGDDVYLCDADMTTFYVNSNWQAGDYSFGDVIANDKGLKLYYGINAFDDVSDELRNALYYSEDTTKMVITGGDYQYGNGSTTSWFWFYNDLEITVEGGTADLTKIVKPYGYNFQPCGETFAITGEEFKVNGAQLTWASEISISNKFTNIGYTVATKHVVVEEGATYSNGAHFGSYATTDVKGKLDIGNNLIVGTPDASIMGATTSIFNVTGENAELNAASAAINDPTQIGWDVAPNQLNITNGAKAAFTGALTNNAGIVNVDDATLAAGSLANTGAFNVMGESTLNIAAATGNAISLQNGANLKDSNVAAVVNTFGTASIADSTLNNTLNVGYNGYADAAVTLNLAGGVNQARGNTYLGQDGDVTVSDTLNVTGDDNVLGSIYARHTSVINVSDGSLGVKDYLLSYGAINVTNGSLTVLPHEAQDLNYGVSELVVDGRPNKKANGLAKMTLDGSTVTAGILSVGQTTGGHIGTEDDDSGSGEVLLKNGSTLTLTGNNGSALFLQERFSGMEAVSLKAQDGSTINATGTVEIGAGAELAIDASTMNATSTFTNAGTIQLDGAAVLTAANGIANTGKVTIGSADTAFSGALNATITGNGTVQVKNADMTIGSTNSIAAKTVSVGRMTEAEIGESTPSAKVTVNADGSFIGSGELWVGSADDNRQTAATHDHSYILEVNGGRIHGGNQFTVRNDGYLYAYNGATVTGGAAPIRGDVLLSGEGTLMSFSNSSNIYGEAMGAGENNGVSTVLVQNGASFVVNGPASIGKDGVETRQGNLVLDNGSATVNSLTLYTSGIVTLKNGGALTVSGALTNDGTISIDSSASITVDSMVSTGSVNLASGALLTFDGALTNTGAITVDMTGLTGFEYKVIDFVDDNADASTLGTLEATNDYKLEVRDGDLFAVKDIDTNLVYVNSAWNGTAANTLVYTDEESNGYFGQNAFAAITDATALTPEKMIVLGGSYSGAQYLNGVDTTIKAGTTLNSTFSAGFKVAGESMGAWSVNTRENNLAIEGGSFKNLFGGDVVASGTAAHIGDVNLSISGGSYSGYVVGGMYFASDNVYDSAVLQGDVNLTISGGTFDSYVCVGNFSSKTSNAYKTTLDGSINLVVDTLTNKVTFKNSVIGGSFGDGRVNEDINVTFTGLGSNLSFTGKLFGCSNGATYQVDNTTKIRTYNTYVSGSTNLTFDAFTGDFKADAMAFQNISFTGDSAVNFTNINLNMADATNWNFEFGSSASNIAVNNFKGDTLNFDLTDWDEGTEAWDVLTGKETSFTGWDDATTKVYLGDDEASWNSDISGWATADYKLTLENDGTNKKFTIASFNA